MAKNKTRATTNSVADFIDQIPDEQKKSDSLRLVEIMSEITEQPAILWGTSIIGFGSYHYKYASGHEGDAPLIGFSPRKAAISLYICSCDEDSEKSNLAGLGKFKMSKACVYIKRLSDINADMLSKIIKESIASVKRKYP